MTILDRRRFLQATGTTAFSIVSAGCSGSNDDTEREYVTQEPDYGDWFGDVQNYEATVDETDADMVRIDVGAGDGFQFDPPAVKISRGTTIIWEWTGSGQHDVVHEGGSFQSARVSDPDFEFEHGFTDGGMYKYFCTPHRTIGMKGAIVVG